MSTSEKIHIVGIGENGLDGLTAAARELIQNAQVLVGDEHTLASLPATKAERLTVGVDLDAAVPANCRGRRPAGGGAGLGRSAVLRRGPLPLRQAGQGPLRGRAARQQHAVGLRPGEGELGRRLLDEPGQSRFAERAGADSRGGEGRAVHDRGLSAGGGRPGDARPRPRLLHRLRLREPRLARRARHPGRAAARWPTRRSPR